MPDNNSTNSLDEKSSDTLQKVGNLSVLANVFMAPQVGMAQVQQRYNVLFPLFLLVMLSGLVMFTYFNMVDYSWYIDYMVENAAGDKSKAEQQGVRDAMSMLSQSSTSIIALVSMLIMIPIIYAVQAAYFVILSNINNDGYEFKQWFSFVAWTATPALISVVAMFAVLLTSSNVQIPPDSINPLSLNELIFGLEPSQGLGKLLSTIHMGQIWSFVVMVIGYQVWTKKTMIQSVTIVLAPFVLFYGAWFLILG